MPSFIKRVESSFKREFPPVTSFADASDPSDLCFHQEVEEAVEGVDDSEGLEFAEDMERLNRQGTLRSLTRV